MKKYNALVREYSGRSLNILARVLIADIKDFPDSVQIRYNSKIIENSTTDLGDLCCGPHNPLQIYKPAAESFPISVRTLNGKCLDIEVSKQDTVEVLKLKIFQKDDTLSPLLQKLYFHGSQTPEKSLWVWRPLGYYKVGRDSTLFLKIKNRLPCSEQFAQIALFRQVFTPINVQATYSKYKKPLQAEKSPSWERYSAGVNFCGGCPNSGCISRMTGRNDGKVVGNVVSYGTTRLDLQNEQLECPACSTPGVKVASLLVSQARAVIRFKPANENVQQIFEESVGSDLFQETIVGTGKGFLEITSVEPWRSPYSCVGCDTDIALKSEEVRLNCGHTYHTWCQSKSQGSGCRVCDSYVLIAGSAKDVMLALDF